MNPERSTAEADLSFFTEIDCRDRWQVYFRLRELGIPCHCQAHCPLLAEVHTADTALQVWSVVNRVARSRQDLVTWLDQCWTLKPQG
ncbi:MAG: hypothetical protein HC812_16190 [Leptolyngbya sp. RL_3_1]|nr:hypothetical protein [Leptolyngbya sp. RL_3_1]